MLNDLSDAVLSCSLPITVTRWAPTPIVKGRKQGKSVCTHFQMLASVQPMGQKELQRLPEGTSVSGAVMVYSKTPLRTVDTAQGRQADEFCHNGVDYQVHSVEDWFGLGGYYAIVAVRLET